jgi:hypothetical protein
MSLSAAAKVLEPAMRHAIRVYRERETAHVPSSGQSDLLDQSLDETLGRLVKGFQDPSWWQRLLDAVEQPFVAPDFLQIPTLQAWLSYSSVQEDLKAEARQQILRTETKDTNRQIRLRSAYAEITGEREELANGPINVVVSVLVAGFVASLSSQLKPVVAIVQAVGAATKEDLAQIKEKLDVLSANLDFRSEDKLVTKAHTDIATERLRIILACRSFSTEKSRANILILLHDVTEGDLRYVESNLRAQIVYWAARLHSGSRDTLHIAEELLGRLRAEAPEFDCRIPQSLILETTGKVEEALSLVAQIDDADGRATAFRILRSSRGTFTALEWFQEQEGRHDGSFLSALGWFNVIVSLCESDRWPEAEAIVARLEPMWAEWPDLAFLDGVINAAMLLPDELRIQALKMNVFHSLMRPRYGVVELKMRTRAVSSLTRATDLLQALGDDGKLRAEVAREWILWLELTDPDPKVVDRARGEVSEGMKNAKRAVALLPFADLFGIEFDAEPIRRYLSHRSKLGTPEPGEVYAELTLSERRMTQHQFAEYLDSEEERLSRVIPKLVIIGKLVETLVDIEQAVKAGDLLDKNQLVFSEHDFKRLKALVAARKGEDPRVELEKLYTDTHSLIDLKNLARHLTRIEDWPALRPLLEELFRVERNPQNATMLVQCYKRLTTIGAQGVSKFFECEPDVETWSDSLAAERAWALFEIGRLQAAKNIVAGLLASRRDINDTNLDINIAIKSGEWERLSAIVDREWAYRDELTSSLLLRLATIAAEADLTPNRALELAKLAAKKAPEDPQILMSAYILLVQIGREEESDPRWLLRAVELSNGEGPIQQVSIKTVAEELIPANRRHAFDINTKLIKGEVPIHFAASILGVPLSRLLIDLPERNVHQVDGRQRILIPLFSGARRPQDISDGAVVGVDVTTLMLLAWLDVLDEVMSAIGSISIPSGTMILLLNERRRVRFHQPSLVHRAERVRDLISQGRLKLASELPKPPEWLLNEVGMELAELIEGARQHNSAVVHAGVIYKVGAYMEEEAQLKEYASFVLSLHAFLEQMHEEGRLTDDEFQRGTAAVKASESSSSGAIGSRGSPTSFFLDDLALTYLGNAGIIEAITAPGITFYVHPSTKNDQDALLSASREGKWLADKLDRIRTTLRDLLDRGQISFLPGNPSRDNERDSDTLTELCHNARDCDVVCIDDRFANRFLALTDESGTSRPLVCTLDLLRQLVSAGRISESRRATLEHRLRAGGAALIDVNESELYRLLCSAKVDSSGELVESAELRILRQYLSKLKVVEILQVPFETSFFNRLHDTFIRIIRKLWEDATLEKEHVLAASGWAFRYICPNPLDWFPNLRDIAQAEQADVALAAHLKLLIAPLVNATSDRCRLFASWLDREVIAPLRPRNSKVIQVIVELCKNQLEQLEKEFGEDHP